MARKVKDLMDSILMCSYVLNCAIGDYRTCETIDSDSNDAIKLFFFSNIGEDSTTQTNCSFSNMADNPEDDLKTKVVVPLDEDDIALLKSYVRFSILKFS
jgi:hypothetical protein